MKKSVIKIMLLVFSALFLVVFLAACSGGGYPGDMTGGYYPMYIEENSAGDNYEDIVENPFVKVSEQSTSAISLTVNTASYTQIRNYIQSGQSIPKNSVKIEEMINYFSYGYDEPESGETFSLSGGLIDTPWNTETKLLTVGLKAKAMDAKAMSHNLVFLVDVSGSMAGDSRLGLSKKMFIKLTDEILDANDTVSIVTYAGSVKTVLDGEKGSNKSKIKSAINSLSAGGSTAGGSGIDLAYRCAFKHKTAANNSRIIIATDGDFNVGASSSSELKSLISENRAKGVYMSAVGLGMGNLSDVNMQEIVHSGQGTYAYVDSEDEAYSLVTDKASSFLTAAAEEAKAQIEFKADTVDSYRLIGYENKQLTTEQWEDSTTPAGAIAGGTTVTAVYELKLAQGAAISPSPFASFVTKYRDAGSTIEQTRTLELTSKHSGGYEPGVIKSNDIKFVSAVVETGLLLRNSAYKGNASYSAVLDRLNSIDLNDNYKAEFKTLVDKLKNKAA